MRKPAFCIGENKDADQPRSNGEASAFVFATQIVQSLFYLNPKFKPLAIFCSCTAWFVSDQVGNQNVSFPTMGLILIKTLSNPTFWIYKNLHTIGYPCSGVRRHPLASIVVRPHFQTSSSPKPLARSKPNLYGASLGKGERKFVHGIWVT